MADITDLLPASKTFSLKKRPNNFGYSDYYGAIHLAARYCGKKYKDSLFHFFWNHGCLPPWQNLHPGAINYGYHNPAHKYFVARKDQETFLRNNGYRKTKAIGMPIIYVPENEITRIPGSLLIMPPHILKSNDARSLDLEEEYLESISEYFAAFKTIYACVSPVCLEKGMWTKTFEKYGIKVLSGADHDDSFALNRMATLFRYYESVTTPKFGSHVPYALYFGAKVSIWGEYQEPVKKKLRQDATWARIPEIAEKFFDPQWRADQERKFFEKFYVPPTDANTDKELGAWFLGAENKQSPDELAELFGWTPIGRIKTASSRLYERARTSELGIQIADFIKGN